MSAYICSKEHFQALASFAAHRHGSDIRVDPRYVKDLAKVADQYVDHTIINGLHNLVRDDLALIYANVLFAENVRSVGYRYPNECFGSLPGQIGKKASIQPSRAHDQYIGPVEILKMCDGLEYQSCETPNYKETLAYRLLSEIRRAAIRSLPGYDKAPWSFDGVEPIRAA